VSERPAPVARLLEELRALDRAYSAGHHGRWSAARRSGFVDACLRDLFAAADPVPGITLVAIGGYGRGMLLPASDVDVLILHDDTRYEEVAALAERILYPLWDAGLRVGHAVRTPPECADLASDRLDTATAMLDGRTLAGDEDAWAAARGGVVDLVRADARGFAVRLAEDAEARRERFGPVSSLLEPDLKEGAGGLRDAQAFGWLEIALATPLEDAGLLRGAERSAVEGAQEFLVRTRSALHLLTGRGTERLVLEQQPAIAAAMGFVDEPGIAAVDALTRSIFEHARQLEHVRSSVFDRYLRGASPRPAIEPSPEGVLRAFADVARDGGVMPAVSLDDVEAVGIAGPVRWTEDVRDAFLGLLRLGRSAVPALETLDRLGLLERFVPAWAPVRCRPQRDPYHRSSVDVHLLESFAEMARLLDDPGTDPLAARAVEAVTDRDAVLVGALLHDIGKTGAGDHVPNGARVATETLRAIGLSGSTRDLAVFLVREHLLLSDTATRRDLEDDDLVLDVAARVGDPERLAALYLLTIADAEATGPLAWTPWRAALVRELVAKVQRVLERGEAGARTAERLVERAEAVRSLLPERDRTALDGFLARMPRGYALALPAERIARHVGLVSPPLGTQEVRTLSAEGSRPGTYELTVVAGDRPGLLSMIAGALTLAGLSILTAQVFTTEDGVAVDVFEVEGAFEIEVEEERWRAFRGTLRKAIAGRVSLDHRVREKRSHYPPPRNDVPVRVQVDNDASDFFTVIEVGAPDRLGLLFDVTRTFAEMQLDVHLAKVATYGARVVDAFYVRDELGRKVDDPEQVAELELALRSRLDG
jgi:[protein-PII] uridylyltransferase